MALFRATGIIKQGGADNPHEAISDYRLLEDGKTVPFLFNRGSISTWTPNSRTDIYVKDSAGNTAFCYVNVNRFGTKFLQTYSDNKWSDNLLSLPEV